MAASPQGWLRLRQSRLPAARTRHRHPRAPAPRNPSSANASANGPLSLSPQGGAAPEPAPTRTAAVNNPVQTAPSAGGGYLVQVSSQKNEADAQASYRMLQGKYPTVLGSRSASIRRVDLGDKGVYYRAMVGPFGSSGRGHPALRQSENRRRTVRHPKELTAVSLTREL